MYNLTQPAMQFSRHILSKIRGQYCVYRYPAPAAPVLEPPALDGLAWTMLNTENVAKLYSAEPRRVADFLRFLRRGAIGVGINIGREWAAHAWMATPGQARPPHIPASISPQAYWIYHCATRPRFGGKGLYKFAQRLLIDQAFQQSATPEILIDTTPDNIASRRAIISTNFAEAGTLSCAYFWLPRVVRYPVWFRWDQKTAHQPLPRGRR